MEKNMETTVGFRLRVRVGMKEWNMETTIID